MPHSNNSTKIRILIRSLQNFLFFFSALVYTFNASSDRLHPVKSIICKCIFKPNYYLFYCSTEKETNERSLTIRCSVSNVSAIRLLLAAKQKYMQIICVMPNINPTAPAIRSNWKCSSIQYRIKYNGNTDNGKIYKAWFKAVGIWNLKNLNCFLLPSWTKRNKKRDAVKTLGVDILKFWNYNITIRFLNWFNCSSD